MRVVAKASYVRLHVVPLALFSAGVLFFGCAPAGDAVVAPLAGDPCAQAAANEERLLCPEWGKAGVTRDEWAARCRRIEASGLLRVCAACIARASTCEETDRCRPPSCGE